MTETKLVTVEMSLRDRVAELERLVDFLLENFGTPWAGFYPAAPERCKVAVKPVPVSCEEKHPTRHAVCRLDKDHGGLHQGRVYNGEIHW